MRKSFVVFILLIISFLSCKKQANNATQNTNQVSSPSTGPCSVPNFTNTINLNGQELVKVHFRQTISSSLWSRRTSFVYYDVSNRIISIRNWDTTQTSTGMVYSCSENQYAYNSIGKVSSFINYKDGNSVPTQSVTYFYNSVPQLTLDVTYGPSMGSIDSAKYVYYPGKIEKNANAGQTVYFVNTANNIDSLIYPTGSFSAYTYDGKLHPFKDLYSNFNAYKVDQNVVDIMDHNLNTLSTFSYTYNANNLPLIGSRTGEITYYFYE